MTPEAATARWLASLPPDTPLAVAVSGGGDSLALLSLLVEAGASVASVLTVNHHLRPEAAEEAQAVAAHAARLGLAHETLDWRWDGQGNLSEAAREGRYGLMARYCRAHGIGDCALGHTRDDNIESFFLGLMRGAGLDGLCGMRPGFLHEGIAFHRPLLGTSRKALRDHLSDRGLRWAEDPGNTNPDYDRARIRAALARLEPDLDADLLARSVANLAATRRDLGQEIAARLEGHVTSDGPDLVFDPAVLAALTPEFRRRALSAALRLIASGRHGPRGAALDRLAGRDWTAEPAPVTLHGCTIALTGGRLRIGREAAAVPGPVDSRALWDGRWRFDGPHGGDTVIRALGPEGLAALDPGWRAAGLPRRSMLAAASVWREGRLVFCPFFRLAEPGAEERWLWAPHSQLPGFKALLLGQAPPDLPPDLRPDLPPG